MFGSRLPATLHGRLGVACKQLCTAVWESLASKCARLFGSCLPAIEHGHLGTTCRGKHSIGGSNAVRPGQATSSTLCTSTLGHPPPFSVTENFSYI
eukprot:141611-Chlamydomonas_euryale.AAC.1